MKASAPLKTAARRPCGGGGSNSELPQAGFPESGEVSVTKSAHQPGAPRLRLLTFAVSVRGALGSEAQTFIRQLSARVAGAVPYRLLDEASWATQGCAPLLRSAITFSARRALAAGIRRSTCSGAEAAYVERCDDQPAPDPACCFDCPVDPAPAEQ